MPKFHVPLLSALAVLLVLAVLFAPPGLRAEPPLPVVASFSILTDLTREVGGDRVQVTTLVGPDGDAHVYEPTPADVRALSQARLLVMNGLGFEGWMERLVEASGYRGPEVVASTGVEPRRAREDHHGHDHGVDPHAWGDPANVRRYVENIRDGLIAADPPGAADYRRYAEDYLARLAALDTEIRASLAAIPSQRRKVVTSHDAFGYFADAFGITFLAPVGINTEAEASALDMAALIRQIRADQIPAVFVETITDPRLLQQIQRETGAQIGGTLYSDALSPPDGPAATYLAMMRHNVRVLAAALAPSAAPLSTDTR